MCPLHVHSVLSCPQLIPNPILCVPCPPTMSPCLHILPGMSPCSPAHVPIPVSCVPSPSLLCTLHILKFPHLRPSVYVPTSSLCPYPCLHACSPCPQSVPAMFFPLVFNITLLCPLHAPKSHLHLAVPLPVPIFLHAPSCSPVSPGSARSPVSPHVPITPHVPLSPVSPTSLFSPKSSHVPRLCHSFPISPHISMCFPHVPVSSMSPCP